MKASSGKTRIGASAILGAAVLAAALVVLYMPQLVEAQSSQSVGHAPHAILSGARFGAVKAVRTRTASHGAITVPGIVSGTWVPLTNEPSFTPESIFVLTDGRIMAQDGNLTNIGWWTLKPDNTGSYINGQWTKENSPSNCPNGYPGQSGSTTYSPLYYGSAVLPDGRLVVIGGEYNYNYTYPTGGSGGMVSNETWTDQGAIYDPVANSWTCITAPPGWIQIGDAQTAVLNDGTFLIANPFSNAVDTLDVSTSPPTFNTPFTPPGKGADSGSNDEEGWTLLPDGTVLTVENYNSEDATETPAIVYNPATQEWESAGTAPDPLVDTTIDEIGPAMLRPDGTVFYEGATGFDDIYDALTGNWSSGPMLPTTTVSFGSCSSKTEQLLAADAPSALLPDGNVLLAVGPIDATCLPNVNKPWMPPTVFFEFDGTNVTQVNAPPNAPNDLAFNGRLLDLPNGQIMWTDGTGDVEIYEPMGTYDPSWAPTIKAAPIVVVPGVGDYLLSGTQFNGLSQAVGYGDDYQGATNYPLVRITNNSSHHVVYARTHDHSTMAVATGSDIVTTEFDVPTSADTGPSTLVVVANGIPSQPVNIVVGNSISGTIEFVPGSERLQLAHSTTPMSDQLNTAFTFIDVGPPAPPSCNAGTDPLNGMTVEIVEGTCAAVPSLGESVGLSFVKHSVGSEKYGTDSYMIPGPGGGLVSARLNSLSTPAGACGEWTLNLELSGLDLSNDGLGGGNPFALIVQDGDGNVGCLDIDNAIVGNQLDPPARTVRR